MQALKNVGMAILGIAMVVGLAVVGLMYIWGIAWVSVRIYEYVLVVNSIAFLLSFLFFLPCAIFRLTRKIAAFGLYGASYVFGITIWIYGFLVTYAAWGLVGVFIGLVFGGVGVVPLGMIAAGLHGQWDVFGQLVLGIALAFGARAVALWLVAKIDKQEEERLGKVIEGRIVPSC
jgi:hypothetical protein